VIEKKSQTVNFPRGKNNFKGDQESHRKDNKMDAMSTFEALNETEVAAVEQAPKKAKKDPELVQATAALREKLMNDPEFKKEFRTRAKDIEVVNTLSFSDAGSIINQKVVNADGQTEIKKVPIAKIVGYIIKNVSDAPVEYQTVSATKGADGKYTETKVNKVIAPGQTVQIPKAYLALLLSDPKFSMHLANGYMKKSSAKGTPKDTMARFEQYHFTFEKGDTRGVHDDDIQINISHKETAQDGTAKWVVNPEYEEVFGIYNNDVPASNGRQVREKLAVDTADVAAFYLRELLAKENQ
jgi:hypothetical protein